MRFAWCWREASVRVAFGKAITRGMEKNIPKRSLDQSRFFAAQTFIPGKEKEEESPFLDEATAGMGGTQEKEKRGSDEGDVERPLLDDGLRRYDVQRVFIPCPRKKLEKKLHISKSL